MELFNANILFLLGAGIFAGISSAWLFQKFKIPKVIGYIVIGILVGKSGFKFIDVEQIKLLKHFNIFALGVIGFLVGGELKWIELKKYIKQFSGILLAEGLCAFFLVGSTIAFITYLISHNIYISISAGMIFGAIASATDPASTMNVLWEYRSLGVLTTTITAIVALDDALALTLYGICTSIAQVLIHGAVSFTDIFMHILIELFGAVGLGVVAGIFINFILNRSGREQDRTLIFTIGTLLLVVSVAYILGLDIILAAMFLGVALCNLSPRKSENIFDLVRKFAGPVYVLFFVLVGARLQIGHMPTWLWGIVGAYVVTMSLGKILGAYVGARITNADKVVRRYAGIGLLAQGGVAIGLSLMAGSSLTHVNVTPNMSLGDMIVFGITATTFIVQIIGTFMVKLSIKLADEMGRNVTEEDIIKECTVKDVMTKDVVSINEASPITYVLKLFSDNDFLIYPVVDAKNKLKGLLSFEGVKNLISYQDCWSLIVAIDAAVPVEEKVVPTMHLEDALELMDDLKTEQLPVVETETSDVPVGILDTRTIKRFLHEVIIERRQQR